jgi:uncharacterized protein
MKARALLASILVLIFSLSATAQVATSTLQPIISVSGTAEIRVAPDEVNLRLGVETRDPKLDEAVKQNETRIAAVLRFLKEAGLEAKNIQTDFVEIHPQFNSDHRAQQVTPEYYVVRRNLGVRLTKVSPFDEVLAGALKAGVNHVMGVEFRTTELRKHRDAARQQAIKAAKEKATALAAELDAKLGKPQSINEQTTGGWWGWSPTNWSATNAMFQNSAQAAASGESSEGNLAVGQISISATVHVTFALD